jgi:dienelactone hydrolase
MKLEVRFSGVGTSRGGELALQLGSMFPGISAVVAYVPANVRYRSCCRLSPIVPYAWTWQGQPLAFMMPRLRNAEMEMPAEIAVEHTQGPILMTSGTDDHVWPSAEMADDVVARLKRQHFAYSVENLKYSQAGHLAGRAEVVPAWHAPTRNPVSGRESDWGGSPKADAESSIDAGPKVITSLGENLNPHRSARADSCAALNGQDLNEPGVADSGNGAHPLDQRTVEY